MRGLNRLVLLAAIAFLAPSAIAQSPVKKAEVKPGARIAIVGDSITEQKLYSRFIESYGCDLSPAPIMLLFPAFLGFLCGIARLRSSGRPSARGR